MYYNSGGYSGLSGLGMRAPRDHRYTRNPYESYGVGSRNPYAGVQQSQYRAYDRNIPDRNLEDHAGAGGFSRAFQRAQASNVDNRHHWSAAENYRNSRQPAEATRVRATDYLRERERVPDASSRWSTELSSYRNDPQPTNAPRPRAMDTVRTRVSDLQNKVGLGYKTDPQATEKLPPAPESSSEVRNYSSPALAPSISSSSLVPASEVLTDGAEVSSPRTPQNAAPHLGLVREFSALSRRTISRIGEIGDNIGKYEHTYKEIQERLASNQISIGKAKDELGQLYGSTFKLLSNQVDAVETSDLNSGKDIARAERKDLTRRAQALLDQIESFRNGI